MPGYITQLKGIFKPITFKILNRGHAGSQGNKSIAKITLY